MSGVVLLWYLCAPLPESRALACRAREAQAPNCTVAMAMVESSLPGDRLWFPAACIDVTPPVRRAGR